MKKGTFSLVAKDPETGRIAVAGASHWFGYATLVPFAKAGVGSIATQAETNTSYGEDSLKKLSGGFTSEQVIENLIKADENRDVRQLILIDKNGKTAGFTGKNCVNFNSHFCEDNFAIAGNMLANENVIPSMIGYFKNSKESLEDKILSTLKSGQNAGGDIRGKRSMGMIIVEPESKAKIELDTFVNIRIDDHQNLFEEATRLLKRAKAYKFMNLGDIQLYENKDKKRASDLYALAFQLDSENSEVQFWYGKMLVEIGEVKKGKELLDDLFSRDVKWREFAGRISA